MLPTNLRTRHTPWKRLLQSFPPPTFLTMPAVGVDVSDQTIKYMELIQKSSSVSIGRFGSVPLEQGIVQGGEVKDMEGLASVLGKLKKDENLNFVRASLPEQKAYFFQTHVPSGTTADDMQKVLEFKLEEHVPLPAQDAVVDYDVLWKKHNKEHLDVGVTVYPRSFVETYAVVFARAGLMPLSFEMEAQAIQRAVLNKKDEGTYIVVDFGETRTGLSIVDQGMLSFTSTLDVSGKALTQIIMKKLSVSADEVARIKTEHGIAKKGNDQTIAEAFMPTVTQLRDEVGRHLSYWESHQDTVHTRRASVSSIILCGGNANIVGLPEYLSHSLSLPAKRANVWQNAFSLEEHIPELDYARSLSYATAIGLALRTST